MSILYRSVLRDAASDAAAAAAAAGGGGGGDAAAQAAAAAAAAPAPFFKGLYGDDGKIDKASWDRLPDRLKTHADQFKKYDTVEALLDGFGNAHSMAVKKALAPLTGTEPPEIVAERNQLLDTINNVPKDPKGYGLARPADLPEQFWNQEGADKFALLAQKHHISPAAMKDLMGLQLELTRGEIAHGQTMETEYYTGQDKTFEAAMKTAGIDMEKATDLATRAAATLGIDPKSLIFRNASVKQALVRFANLVAEDKLVTGDNKQEGDELAMARDIANNPQNPLYKAWHDPNDPQHEAAKARRDELYRIDGEKKRARGINV